MGIRCADHVTPLYPQKLALTSPTGGGPSVGIVRSRTKATEFSLVGYSNCSWEMGVTNRTQIQHNTGCCCLSAARHSDELIDTKGTKMYLFVIEWNLPTKGHELRYNEDKYMRSEEKPIICHYMLYCTYDTHNIFRALLCPSSGALDYMYVIAACGVLCLADGCTNNFELNNYRIRRISIPMTSTLWYFASK